MITLSNLKKHIHKCLKRQERFNFLGFVESQDLTSEVESHFTLYTSGGAKVYDWVKGNDKLKALIMLEAVFVD